MNEWAEGYVTFMHLDGRWLATFLKDPPVGTPSYPCRIPVPPEEFKRLGVNTDRVAVAEVEAKHE